MKRRAFFKQLGAGLLTATGILPLVAHAGKLFRQFRVRYLRPPGALPEADFLSACIRCGQCAEICPNDCIKFFGAEQGIESLDTPYIIPREKACILCMKCGDVCPTGALKSIPREASAILEDVKMGHARVDTQLCLSYQGKTCGVCYRACPLPDIALSVGRLEQPHVSELCVGCGLCERSCIQIPQAIKVIPSHVLAEYSSAPVNTVDSGSVS